MVLAACGIAARALSNITSCSRPPKGSRRDESGRLGARRVFWLHGSPRTYWSRYDENAIAALAATIGRLSTADEVWCVFDNTASGAAIENAWDLRERLIVDPAPS